MVRSKPARAFDILRLAPHAIRDLRQGSENLRSGQLPDDFPRYLLRAGHRGLIEGGFMYIYETLMDRRHLTSVSQNGALDDVAHT